MKELKDVQEKLRLSLKAASVEIPELEADIMLCDLFELERSDLYVKSNKEISPEEESLLNKWVARRAQGEPLAYILGWKDFYQSRFVVGPGVLVPRPETEMIVEEVLSLYGSQSKSGLDQVGEELFDHEQSQAEAPAVFLNKYCFAEFGVGSGCLGLSILREMPESFFVGVDISKDAISTTAENAENFGFEDNFILLELDLTKAEASEIKAKIPAMEQGFDFIVANPPYIAWDDIQIQASVKQFEPHEALFSSENGLFHLRKWSALAHELLRPGGFIFFEIGTGQGLPAQEILKSCGFEHIEIKNDLQGHQRLVMGKKSQ